MPLADHVSVSRRFQRAIRIDTDLGDPSALDGFVCPRSFGVLLENMARQVSESGQGAFTWTGPYGSGKSSLAVALSALLSPDKAMGRRAARLLGKDTTAIIRKALPRAHQAGIFFPSLGAATDPNRLPEKRLRRAVSLKDTSLCSGMSNRSLRR